MPKNPFNIDDAYPFEHMLSEEDCLILQSPRDYALSNLDPRAL